MQHKSSSHSPNHRFVIALHSLDGNLQTGPTVSPLEKRASNLAQELWQATFSESGFLRNTWNCGRFRRYSEQSRRVSLHLRLTGGGCSLLRTLLRLNSLLTGNNTGNFGILGRPNSALIAVIDSFCGTSRRSSLVQY